MRVLAEILFARIAGAISASRSRDSISSDRVATPTEPAGVQRPRQAVVSHALRHLAFLVAQDPDEYRAKLSAQTRRALRRLKARRRGTGAQRVARRVISVSRAPSFTVE